MQVARALRVRLLIMGNAFRRRHARTPMPTPREALGESAKDWRSPVVDIYLTKYNTWPRIVSGRNVSPTNMADWHPKAEIEHLNEMVDVL